MSCSGFAPPTRLSASHTNRQALTIAVVLLGPATIWLGTRGSPSSAPGHAMPGAQGTAQNKNAPWNVPPLKNAFKGKFLIGTTLNYPALQGRAPMDVAIATRHFN